MNLSLPVLQPRASPAIKQSETAASGSRSPQGCVLMGTPSAPLPPPLPFTLISSEIFLQIGTIAGGTRMALPVSP